MKRSGFKPRTSPMSRGAGLSPGSSLKRTGPLKQRSKKQARVYAGSEGVEGRADFVARILGERPTCEACPPIAAWADAWRCCPAPTEVHEILRRSAGGDILDEANVLAVCHSAHRWIHSHPKEARTLGLLKSRYAGRNEPQP